MCLNVYTFLNDLCYVNTNINGLNKKGGGGLYGLVVSNKDLLKRQDYLAALAS